MDALDSSSSRYRTGSHFRPVDAADEPRDAEIQATLAEAEALVLDGQFRPALRLIVKAINMCPCEPAGQGKQRHPKDKSCHIDQCMLAVNSGDPYALFEVAKSPCTCGYRWPSCTHQHHAAALDALANCLDRDAQYVAAFAAALAIIRLDPASAMGYCRGARIIRYLLKSASPHGDSAQGRAVTTIFNQFTGASSPLFLRAVLKRFVRGGVRIIDRHRRNPKDTYNVQGSIPIPFDTTSLLANELPQVVLRRMAYHLDCDDARMDPVKEFPMEIIGLIFSQLDIADLGLTLGPAMLCVMDPRSRLWSPRFLPPFPTSLQSLEILSANENVARTVLFTTASPAAAINATALLDGNLMDLNLPQLEVFRCLSSILKPRHLEHILEPSVSAGKLQALELRAAFNHLTPPGGGDQPGDFVPARDLDFLTCSSLHTLGLHDFNFFENPSGRWVATNEFYAEPFVDWLDCFPSLRTLGVYPGDWEAVGLLIPRLIARPGIKAIHQQYLRGLSWDEAQKLARKHGVKLCHSPGHMPAGWRVFEDFDDDTST
ncbi:hypothetical protein F5144DRAFT_635901 [Chaetomium tenue]|uniref:Uncharacterized protein n=1 Tax=Chaetomium tenue TaxID=1854479 RepID=A0ACB7PLK6_9PEZI|nr:hypothetical protein F5144DRAFT_635901 [Chaetomium globosum]